MFYFREKELQKLHSFSDSNYRSMAIYGRRRVGKTQLILHFSDNNENIKYYQCTSYDYNECLKDFIENFGFDKESDSLVFSSTKFRDVFSYIDKTTKNNIIVIDEFPFLAKKNDNVPVEFQWIIDHSLKNNKLILLGSNVSFMKQQITDSSSPLYGRFDEIIEVKPFTFNEVKIIFNNFEDAVKVYSCTGGISQYVMFFKNYKTFDMAIDDLFFNHDGRLFMEADNLLMQEFRDISSYKAILKTIGSTRKNGSFISKNVNIDSRGINSYINKLIDLEIISIYENVLLDKKTGNIYYISDLFYRFYFTFIEPNKSAIARLGPTSKTYILDNLYDEYLGIVYEEIVKNLIYDFFLEKKIHFMPDKVGAWWGNVLEDDEWHETQVDIIAYDNDNIIIGECKYKKKKIGNTILDNLKNKSIFIPTKNRNIIYLLASRSGFVDEIIKLKSNNLILIDKDNML